MLDGDTRKSASSSSALAGRGGGIHGSSGLVHDRTHLVVIPAVGVVISDDYGGARPILLLLQEVDDGGDEGLLVQRIGVAGVTVLITRSLKVADRGEVAGVDSVVEIVSVVLVIGWVAINAHATGRRGPGVLQVLGGDVVLEGLVMRNIIRLVGHGDRRSGAAGAPGGSVRVLGRQV